MESPSSYGLNDEFHKSTWHITRPSISEFIRGFFSRHHGLGCLNKIYFVLIHKIFGTQ